MGCKNRQEKQKRRWMLDEKEAQWQAYTHGLHLVSKTTVLWKSLSHGFQTVISKYEMIIIDSSLVNERLDFQKKLLLYWTSSVCHKNKFTYFLILLYSNNQTSVFKSTQQVLNGPSPCMCTIAPLNSRLDAVLGLLCHTWWEVLQAMWQVK